MFAALSSFRVWASKRLLAGVVGVAVKFVTTLMPRGESSHEGTTDDNHPHPSLSHAQQPSS